MLAIARGIFSHQLNWTMILIGMAVGGPDRGRRHHAAHLPRGAHAGAGRGIGIYLPPTVAAPLVAGALLAWALERALRRCAAAAGQRYDDYADAANRRAC